MNDLSEKTVDAAYQLQVIASARTEFYNKLREDSVKVTYTGYNRDKLVSKGQIRKNHVW